MIFVYLDSPKELAKKITRTVIREQEGDWLNLKNIKIYSFPIHQRSLELECKEVKIPFAVTIKISNT